MAIQPALSESVRQVAAGELDAFADSFANAGFHVRVPARGMLQICSSTQTGRPRLLLSAGIHGDETAPIEMIAALLEAFVATPRALALDLMVVIGNLAAIQAGERYIEADLNRLFRSERADLATAAEAARADAIMRAVSGFLAAPTAKWHLDLHTAIRASRYPTFAVVPEAIDAQRLQSLLCWLDVAGIGAAILNPTSAGTFSAYTAQQFGAASATLELGRIGVLGKNDMSQFRPAHAALSDLLRSGRMPRQGTTPHVYRVAQPIVKHSERFHAHFNPDAENFSPIAPGSVVAVDGDTVYRAGAQTEYLVFPNPHVRVGLRAGLTVVRCA